MTTYRVDTFTNGTLTERDVIDTTAVTFTVFNGALQQQSQRALTPAEVTQYAAMDTDTTSGTNQVTIRANVQTHITQLESWMTANPNGAVLTAAQTKFVAQTLIGLGRLMLGLTSTVGGAT